MITRASTYIKAITFSRVDENNIPEEVKAAACAVAEVIYKAESSTEGEKKSENTDGYSVTYVTEQTDGEIKEVILRKKQYAAAYPHLVLTGLLKQGVFRDDTNASATLYSRQYDNEKRWMSGKRHLLIKSGGMNQKLL